MPTTTERQTQAKPKFTPGPWPYEFTGDGKRIVIGKGLVDGPNGYEVAEVYSDDCDTNEAEANARLIAAAPDLLEALKQVMGWVDGWDPNFIHDDEWPEAAHHIRAAIAKAEG